MKQLNKKPTQPQKPVEVFTKFAHIKFMPQIPSTSKTAISPNASKGQALNLLTKVKTYFGLSPSKPEPQKSIKSPPHLKTSFSLESSTSLSALTRQATLTREGTLTELQLMQNLSKLSNTDVPISLKHFHKLTNDHFLIGNEDQLDVINVNCIVGDYVDTEVVWSVNVGRKVELVAVDAKRSLFVLITKDKEIIAYEYLLKRSSDKPKRMAKLKIQQTDRQFSPKYAQFYRDSQLIVFCIDNFLIFSLEGNQIQRKSLHAYPAVKQHNLKLFQVPNLVENKLNIFFEQKLQNSDKFALWCLEVDLLSVKFQQPTKVYQIETIYKNQLQIQNYSKDVYLLNFGFEILAVKKGYVIDSANANIQAQQSTLRYLGNQRLVHVTKTHVDVYHFDIKLSNPPKIYINPQDSILLPSISQNFQFFKISQILSSSLALFYQISPLANSLIGETRYKFALTKRIPFQQKIQLILPSQNQIGTLSSSVIEQKCSMIKKMGLSTREAYLKMWNRSLKLTVGDFKFLLSTDNYETIKQQIQKKLRKSSMSYRELQAIEKVCCQMLSQKVYGANFEIGQLKNYLISSFLIKKYELYFQFSKIAKKHKAAREQLQNRQNPVRNMQESRSQPTKTMINVQDYHNFSKAEIKSLLLELMSEYCVEQKPQYVQKIRVILKSFKFCLSIDYLKLVEEMIRLSHNNLLVLMEAVPEVLPYRPNYAETEMPEDPELYEGVWGEIATQEWEQNLHKDRIITVYNKQQVEEAFQSDVWYKRNWVTLHGCVFLTRAQITKIHEKNKGDDIFYSVINQIFEKIHSQQKVDLLLAYIETRYPQMPAHLKEKIWLYKRLWDYLVEKGLDQGMGFEGLLKLQDFELFKLIFKHEKTYKNLIFTEIKPLFRQICTSDEAFNQGLLNYFNSPLSQISDVKYLLNRMNNQKCEFHVENEQTYEVLVKAIQSKIKIGSGDDTPIDQVLIYIENIPIEKDNEMMRQLEVIKRIGEEVDKFQAMKLDMSLYEIINNPDSVISSLISYEISQSHITSLKSLQAIKTATYTIIAESQAIKQKIYTQEQVDLTLFIFLSKLLEHQKMLPYVKHLLNDIVLAEYYTIDEMLVENLVLFMYKQKFAVNPVYVNSKGYVMGLVGLLPEDNLCRRFIQSEVELAVYLSPAYDPLWYPITGKQSIISVFQLEAYINNLPNDMLASMDPKFIHQKAKTLQQIASDSETSNIHLLSIYEFIILKLIHNSQLHQALQMTKKCFTDCQKQPSDYLYPAMILSKVIHELCQENRQAISLCNRYLFYEPKEIVGLLDDLMNHRYNSAEQKDVIIKVLANAQKNRHVFDQRSALLDQSYTQLLTDPKSPANNPQMYNSFDILLIEVQRQLIKLKDDFKTFDFHIIFALLSNEPYILVKWVFLQRFQLNLKNFRCFLSYFIKEDLFNKISVLEFGKRLFKIIHVSITEQRPIDEVIEEYKSIPLTQIMEFQRIKLLQNQMDRKICKSLQRFKSKLKMVKTERVKIKAESMDEAHFKINKMVEQVKSPLYRLMQPFKYAFYDSDDDAQNKESQIKRQEVNKSKKQNRNIFEAKLQRTLLMSRRLTGMQTNLRLSSQKSIASNMYFSQNFGIKGEMLNGLVKSKKFPTLKKSRDQLTFARSGSPYQSGIMKNEQQNDSFLKTGAEEKKVKRKFGITKARSQYVNLSTFMSFEKLVNSIDKEKQTSKTSEVPSLDEMQLSRQLKMQTKTESSPGQADTQPILQPQQKYLMANRYFSKIRKISQEINDLDMTEFPSQKGQAPPSQQSLIDIELIGQQAQDESEGNTQTRIIINEQLVGRIVEEIVKMMGNDEKAELNIDRQLEQLEQERYQQSFPDTVKLLIDRLYEQSRSISQILNVIKSIADKFPQSNINKHYASLYIRMAQLHSKFSLNFPLRKVFVAAALTLEKGSSSALYSYLSPFLESFIDEENIMKVGKVLSLGFQRSQIELEVHFILLRRYIKEITIVKEKIMQASYISQNRIKEDIDLYNSELQKLQTYMEKIPANVFIQKDQDIFAMLSSFDKDKKQNQMQSSQVSISKEKKDLKEFNYETFVGMIVRALKKRGDGKIAEMLEQKWEKNIW